MRVLMVISEAPPVRSGVARVAARLQRGLARRGHEVEILSLRDIPRLERGELRLSSMLFKLPALRQRLAAYDVIHLHGPVPTFSDVFLLAGRHGLGAGQPGLVYTHHAAVDLRHFPYFLLAPAYNALQERMARLADQVVVSTTSYGQRLGRFVPSEKLSVIPWGVDFECFAGPTSKPGPFTVLFVGQIRPYKGLPILLKALDGLEGVRLWVIGDGHRAEACRALARSLHLAEVHFFGHLPGAELARRLRAAHTVVLPSITRSEAFGLVLLEGMAAGCVPIASHLPGVADVVGQEGYTFPPGDHRALRTLLIRLRDDQVLTRQMATFAQARARLYPWERTIFGYEHVLLRAAREPAQKPAWIPRTMPKTFLAPDFPDPPGV